MSGMSTNDEMWRSILTHVDSPLRRNRRLMKLLPAAHRCKLCNLPFSGPTAPMMRLTGHRRAKMNPQFCSLCEAMAESHPGGVELELTMLFADIRGSTPLAESLGTDAFRHLIGRFFDSATRVLIASDALIDRLIGDEVIALFLPILAGTGHAERAIQAAGRILVETGHRDPQGPWAPVGIGLHTGKAFVGSVGSAGVTDFTALGDEVNATARLASAAGAGEILVSASTAQAAGLQRAQLEFRRLELKGRQQAMEVYVMGPAGVPATP
jgi:adenylate cyclase